MSKKVVGVYLLHNKETGEGYIGSGYLNRRRRQHYYYLNKGEHVNRQLQAAFDRNPNFDFVDVPTETIEEAREFEDAIIQEHWGNPYLLNLSKSAYACRIDHTEETKQRLREIHTGRVISEETRKKISDATKGRHISPEHVEKLRLANTGRVVSEETRELLRQKSTGRAHSEEAKLKMSESRKGRIIDESWRANLSAATKGVPKSPEHVQKVAAGHCKVVSTPTGDYASLKEFAAAHRLPLATASRWVNDPNRSDFKYKDAKRK